MQEKEKIYAHAFNSVPKIGSKKLRRIQKYFKNFESAWHCANQTEFIKAGIEEKVARVISEKQSDTRPDSLWQELAEEKVDCLAYDEKTYPQALLEIHSPPLLLYRRGKLEKTDSLAVAIVGTRKMSDYGQQMAIQLASELAANSITIISGLAIGIDSIAHQAALDAGGRTIAVLGGSVAQGEVFPKLNAKLGEKITEQGALLSEYVPGVPPLKQNFPVRNRLISGMSVGVIVIEAARRSGALITAWQALEQNREVMAVPGNVNATMSQGTNLLIKKGAALIRNTEDVLDVLSLEEPKQIQEARKILPETETEKEILAALDSEPKSLDKIMSLTKFDVNVISSTLSVMEVKGFVKQFGKGYIKC